MSLATRLLRARFVFPEDLWLPSDFAKDHDVCFFQRADSGFCRPTSGTHHTLFFTLLGGLEEESEGGILFKNDFVILTRRTRGECRARISDQRLNAQLRYTLTAMESRTEGTSGHAPKGAAVKLVATCCRSGGFL